MKLKGTLRFLAVSALMLAAGCASAQPPLQEDAAASQIRTLVRSLGYGAGIHHFKNYVLRGKDDYRTRAEQCFTKAEETIAALRGIKGLTDKEKEALDGIGRVVKQYKANLPTAQKMIAEGKGIQEIDAAVKVDDAPGKAGLAVLRDGRKWSALDTLDAALGYVGAIHHFKNYVLRGTDEYRTNAIARFKEARDAIATLRGDAALGDKEKKALDDIEGVVKRYEANVSTAQTMMAERKSIKEIDTAVKVDDAPAIAGLAVLRKE